MLVVALRSDDPVAVRLIEAIRAGDVESLGAGLGESPGVASAGNEGRRGSRTALHVATDWPGYFPNGPAVVGLLLDSGADLNSSPGYAPQTPLDIAGALDTRKESMVTWLRELGATSADK
jgi:hypothetical protein